MTDRDLEIKNLKQEIAEGEYLVSQGYAVGWVLIKVCEHLLGEFQKQHSQI